MVLIRNKWMLLLIGLAGAGLAAIIGIILLFTFLPRLFQLGQPPRQPIVFSHKSHVQKAEMQCTFCHRGAETSAVAGVPSLEQCMFCHRVISRDKTDVQKLAAAYQENRPVDWMRIERLPDSVHFNHEPHLRGGLYCVTCHGDVGSMTRVKQARSLKMGDCLACHRKVSGPTECSFCHY